MQRSQARCGERCSSQLFLWLLVTGRERVSGHPKVSSALVQDETARDPPVTERYTGGPSLAVLDLVELSPGVVQRPPDGSSDALAAAFYLTGLWANMRLHTAVRNFTRENDTAELWGILRCG